MFKGKGSDCCPVTQEQWATIAQTSPRTDFTYIFKGLGNMDLAIYKTHQQGHIIIEAANAALNQIVPVILTEKQVQDLRVALSEILGLTDDK